MSEIHRIVEERRAAHYAAMTIQPLEVLAAWQTREQFWGFLYGNCVKYLARCNCSAPGKGGRLDLLKARDYLNRLIDLDAGE